MMFDVGFFLSCATKVLHGAWLPLVIGGMLIVVMSAWRIGWPAAGAAAARGRVDQDGAVGAPEPRIGTRARHRDLSMMEDTALAPRSFLHNLKHNKCAHQQIVFLSIQTTEELPGGRGEPVSSSSSARASRRVKVRFGFMSPESPR